MPDTIEPIVVFVVPIAFVCLYVQFMSTVAPRSQASITGQNLSIQQARVVNVQLLGLWRHISIFLLWLLTTGAYW